MLVEINQATAEYYNIEKHIKQQVVSIESLENYNVTVLLHFRCNEGIIAPAFKETFMFTTTTALAALLLAGAQADQSATAPVRADVRAEQATLAADQLAKGRTVNAIAALEKHIEAAPEDPALLINLGIAHAQEGNEQMARMMFERALVSPEPTELETAEGDTIDSRRLARKAMRMLERGEFATRISRRD